MTFAIVIPVHERRLLAARVIEYYKDSQPDIPVVTVGGPDDIHGDFHIIADNEPLGAKFNYGVQGAMLLADPDYVCVIGSDSFVHPDYFDAVRAQTTRYPYINSNGAYFFFPPVEMLYAPRFRCGSGVFLSRILLERCNGRPYVEDATKNLDAGPRRHAGCGGTYEFNKPWVLEERGVENMWGEAWVRDTPGVEQVDPLPILEHFDIR